MKKAVLCFFTVFIINFCFAQQDLSLGKIYQLPSQVLNENRVLNIYTPEGYNADSAKTYPVIYLLDGSVNEDFIHITGLVQFLTMIEATPKSIVIGIANVDRRRDFTFPTSVVKDKQDFPTTGSSAKFINFLAEELQPFVEKTFKTNGVKTVIGQSFGGLLATEILMKRASLFNNYIIVSPSLWWDNGSLLKNPTNQTPFKANVFISVGEEGKIMKDDAKKLAETLSKSSNLKVGFEFFEKEDHLTILHNSVYQTLLKMYKK
ncbi:MAG: alpha/beta hydrolase-fold protein [Pedobacter sp.]|jgi:hypothetical protein|uniref:alpha/beta hydrolase n=1 Tax=Pedobacter sp. TaxID=1411316 RepID=UPI003565AA7F